MTSTSQPTLEHLSGRGMDGGATASTDATHVQEVVRRKMAAAEAARQRARDDAAGIKTPEEEARVGTRSDGSFGLLSEDKVVSHEEVGDEGQITKPMDQMDIKPVRGILKNRDGDEGGRKASTGSDTLVGKDGTDGQEEGGEEKKEPELKRRVSKMWKSAIVKIRGPAVARGL